MKTVTPLTIAIIASASWTVWYQSVIKRITRSTVGFGPPGLVAILSSFTKWLAEQMGHCSLETSDQNLPKRQVMMGWHPHGVYMITAAFFGGKIFCNPANNPEFFVCVQNLLFRIPGVSEFLILVNGRSANRNVIKSLLEAGHSVGVTPGGMYEQVRTDPNVEAVYFPQNLGFIRIAIEHGVPLLPVYIFGENQLYGQNQITQTVNKSLRRYFGVGSLFVIGRFGLPWPVFKPTSLYLQYGNLVEVGPPEPNPSEERVREVFEQYVSELRRIFAMNAHARLPPENAKKGLKIVWRGHSKL